MFDQQIIVSETCVCGAATTVTVSSTTMQHPAEEMIIKWRWGHPCSARASMTLHAFHAWYAREETTTPMSARELASVIGANLSHADAQIEDWRAQRDAAKRAAEAAATVERERAEAEHRARMTTDRDYARQQWLEHRWSSAELAELIGKTDRTARNWINEWADEVDDDAGRVIHAVRPAR